MKSTIELVIISQKKSEASENLIYYNTGNNFLGNKINNNDY